MFKKHPMVQPHARAHLGVHADRSSKRRFSLDRRSLEWRLFNTFLIFAQELTVDEGLARAEERMNEELEGLTFQ